MSPRSFSLLVLLTFTQIAYSQSGAHKPSGPVTHVYVSQAADRFLTISRNYGVSNIRSYDVAFWDNATARPLWIKSLADFGFKTSSMSDAYFRVSPDLSHLWANMPGFGAHVINLTTGQSTPTNIAGPFFTADNFIVGKATDKKTELVLINPFTQARVKLAGDVQSFGASRKGDKIFINEKGKVKFYDVASRTWDKKSVTTFLYFAQNILPVQFSSTFLVDRNTVADLAMHTSFTVGPQLQRDLVPAGDYFVDLDQDGRTVLTYDKSAQRVSSFALAQNTSYDIKPLIWSVDDATVRIDVLEHKLIYVAGSPVHYSYFNSYDARTGKLLRTVELTSESAEALAANEKLQKDRAAAYAAEQALINSPEMALKRRLWAFERKFVMHKTSKLIYYVVPDVGLYQGNTVKLMEQHDDKKLIVDVYEPLDNLEQDFTVISRPVTCSVCRGSGIFSSSHTTTVADLEYTTGKKLEQTTTRRGTCGTCGGCGLVPAN